jgi:predicted AlkP superfamily pyrophosphatase or phosphodiesterase
LRRSGRYFSRARYAHSNTETAPGHATLFSGTSPRKHGIVANEWWDYSLGRSVASTFDPSSPLLQGNSAVEKSGRSPRALREPTLGDVLLAQLKGSKVYAVSLKDRGAIFPGGTGGKAIWFQEGAFNSSRYYFDDLPAWLLDSTPNDALTREWTLLDPLESYKNRTVPRSRFAPQYLGEGFPHRPTAEATLEKVLRTSPLGDEAVLALARKIISAEQLGADASPDLLSISLSSNDYVSHYFGPESIEAEDLLRHTDLELRRFLDELETHIPRESLLFVLSSDHGGSESPEELTRRQKPAGRVGSSQVKTALEAALAASGLQRKVLDVIPPYAFLERTPGGKPLTAKEATLLEKKLAESLPMLEALRSTAHLEGDDAITASIREAVYPGTSGDLYLVFKPHQHFLQESTMASTHGSPWDYDREVPIVIAGGTLSHGETKSPVVVSQLAPQVALELGLEWADREALREAP